MTSADLQRRTRLYFMGICGIAMGTLAAMLKDSGYEVLGSDTQVYPPMSTFLAEKGIPVLSGWNPQNLEQAKPQVAIVGNVIRRDNPEAQRAKELGLPLWSMPQALDHFFFPGRKNLVVCGTHGKTTTAGLLGWILEQADLDPTVFVGGFVRTWRRSYRIGEGPFMVLEGDEYDTAFFDKHAKFLRYKPWLAVVTGIEFDHADIYRDLEHVMDAFRALSRLIPADGYLVIHGDDPRCAELAALCPGTVITYGTSSRCQWRLVDCATQNGAVVFTARSPDGAPHRVTSPLPGRHNALNTIAAMAVCRLLNVPTETLLKAVDRFGGMKRRQEVIYQSNEIVVLDDFAHHPTAVKETIQAVKAFYPHRRLLALFEPRTNSSRRRFFQHEYANAFHGASWVGIKEPKGFHSIAVEERLDTEQLVKDIQERSAPAHLFVEGKPVLPSLLEHIEPKDVVLLMSNGSMDGLPMELCQALQAREQKVLMQKRIENRRKSGRHAS
ncbi:UDP-N-acetylmuramate--L-alanine ligase [Desulfosoma caldarium]|nr:Mur ligase family protein [Desulfosoma caldarium]